MTTWAIIGCGYTGTALARRLVADGHQVVITRRDADRARALAAELGPTVRGVAVDVSRPEGFGPVLGPRFAVPAGSVVVYLAPPGADPAGESARLAEIGGQPRLVYVSSTGVYAPGGGAWVDEEWPLAPATAAGRARLAAERALPPGAIVLRAAGIHGPGRGLVERLRAGTYRIVGDGAAHVSRIHVADLVEAIVRAGAASFAGAVNVADDEPDPIGLVADTLAAQLGVPAPPRVPVDRVDAELAGMLAADRRIANGRMKRELGVTLRYPSWRGLL